MFAVLNNHIRLNAGRELAFQCAGIFYVRIHCTTLYRCSNTPVYRLNGRTAFSRECVKQRVRFGHLFYLYLCYSITTFPILHCLAETERPPTKRASDPSRLPEILTPTSHAWAWTCRAATSATAARPTRRGTPLPARHPYRHVQHLRHGLHHGSRLVCAAGGARARQMAGEAGVPPPLPCREADAQHPRLHRPASRRYHIAGLPLVTGATSYYCFPPKRLSTESRPGRVHPEPDELPTPDKQSLKQ